MIILAWPARSRADESSPLFPRETFIRIFREDTSPKFRKERDGYRGWKRSLPIDRP
jgi:hypothetical protein